MATQENEVMMALNGGDIESMLSGMDSGEQEAMGELEQMAPEMEMIDQLVNDGCSNDSARRWRRTSD
jgi:hypothetical protein